MSKEDRERWNRRYAERTLDWEPNSWLLAVSDEIRPEKPGARALDIACGQGRNSIQLARLSYAVDAWDISDVGLGRLRERLDALAAAGERLDVRPRLVDLDQATMPPSRYALLANIFFLDRRLFPMYLAALRPGGWLVFETFVDLGDGRRALVSPEHMLRPGELRDAFAALGVLRYEEDAKRGTARLLARRS
ncbi:MAG: SAM-dependent methyltransferase [Chloroflexota bacterium]|nr:SAM-dependent methyltransferase [Chloroflexota bacterium]